MKTSKRHVWVTVVGLLLVCTLVLEGCSSWNRGSSPPPNPITQQSQPTIQGSQTGTPAALPPTMPSGASTIRPIYYDFPDIPIPQELSLRPKDSYIFQAGQFKAGLLTLRGRVELSSLINFFQMALPREGWTPKGGFRYRRSVLIFEKPDKTCVINLYDTAFFTYAEIYVAPVSSQI